MHWLEHHWYRISPLHLLLWPISLLFAALSAVRRLLYRAGVLSITQLTAPVIVVGNITVGGTGKTPLVIKLAALLRDHGLKPGIVCRGYGGSAHVPRRVAIDSDPLICGDEAVLLARRSGCPVWIAARRTAAARALLAAHAECNVIISDDGLQHYALARDVAISVIDGERGFGNGMLLPAGPLREPRRLLNRVDAMVINGDALFAREILPSRIAAFDMAVSGTAFFSVANPQRQAGPEYFSRLRVHAVAAIGNPRRFFDLLRRLGISFVAHPFPDHHRFVASDFVFEGCDAIIMTEKDAVKCEGFCSESFWMLRVDAEIDSGLVQLVLRKIKR